MKRVLLYIPVDLIMMLVITSKITLYLIQPVGGIHSPSTSSSALPDSRGHYLVTSCYTQHNVKFLGLKNR